MNSRLLRIAGLLEQKYLLKEANSIYSLLKLAGPSKAQEENRDFFANLFLSGEAPPAPDESPDSRWNKLYAIADQYYKKFRNTPEFQNNLQGLRSIDEVIALIRAEEVVDPKQQAIKQLIRQYPDLSEELEGLSSSEVNPSYYNWVIKIRLNEEQDPMNEIIKAVLFYQRNAQNLEQPLESFNLLSELRAYFDDKLATNKEYYYSKIEPHAMDPKNTDFIYDSENFKVVLSGTIPSSQYWASGTTWCTSYLENNMFSRYSSKGIYLYYVITEPSSPIYEKGNPNRKMSIGFVKKDGEAQLLTQENATVDVNNHNISLESIKSYLGEEADAIVSSIYNDLDGREDTKFNEIIANTTVEDLESQLALINDKSQIRGIKKTFAESPRTSSEVLLLLARDKNLKIRHPVADNPNTPPEALLFLARDKNLEIRRAVADNPNTPPEALLLLARDKNLEIRRAVAQNSNTPYEVLLYLAQDKWSSDVRSHVASNKNVTSEVLAVLAEDSWREVRIEVVNNSNITPELLSILANDVVSEIRASVAKHPNTPPEALLLLARDKYVRDAVAGNPSTPPELLLLLARDEDLYVRYNVARNPSAPPEELMFLARDENRDVRSAALSNPNYPKESGRVQARLMELSSYLNKVGLLKESKATCGLLSIK
jgi:hypothetical protein